MQSCCWEDMILSSAQEKADYEFVNKYWSDFGPMTYGRFDICDMEGQVDYSAARKFTEARLEEIKQVERAVLYLNETFACGPELNCVDCDIMRGTKSREEAALKELRRGMKI